MQSLEQFIERVRAEIGGEAIVLASHRDLSSTLCLDLLDRRIIAGFVANSSSESALERSAGWWVARPGGPCEFKKSKVRNILVVGLESQISGSWMLAARRAGFSTLLLGAPEGENILRYPISKCIAHRAVLLAKNNTLYLASSAVILASRQRSFERAFDAVFDAIGDRLRLQPKDFDERRVAMVIGSLGAGGAERQATLTAVGLAKRGRFQPTVAVMNLEPGQGDFFRPVVERGGVRVDQIESLLGNFDDPVIQEVFNRSLKYRVLNFHNLLRIILSYAYYFRAHRPYVVQSWMDYCNVLAGIGAELAGVPHIVLGGRSLAPEHFALFQHFMRPGYRSLLAKRPDIVFTNNSQAGADDYARWLSLPTSRFKVLHNGFEFPADIPLQNAKHLREQLKIPADALVVGSIIRFSEEKRPLMLIDIADKVLAACPKAYFVIFGAGAMLETARKLIEKRGLQTRVILPGPTSDAWAACSLMDVFVLASRAEGLPNVLIEAQAMGVPVVTTGQGGMIETYIEDKTGLTARPANAAGMAQGVLKLLNHPEMMREFGQAAEAHARSSFNIDRMISSTSNVFETKQFHPAAATDRLSQPGKF